MSRQVQETLPIVACCYGPYPQLAKRLFDSIYEMADNTSRLRLHIGCSECCQETLDFLRQKYDAGMITTLLESRPNINMSPIMRTLINVVEEQYFVWFDDDVRIIKKGWDSYFIDFINGNHKFAVAGGMYTTGRGDDFKHFLEKSPWWVGWGQLKPSIKDHALFAVGSCRIINAGFVRQHKFPDYRIVKKFEDSILGDLCEQQGQPTLSIPDIATFINREEKRRGHGESFDGWKDVDPITGLPNQVDIPVKIISVKYGIKDRVLDATVYFNSKNRNGVVEFVNDDTAWSLIGDPVPGSWKSFYVTYEMNGKLETRAHRVGSCIRYYIKS